jgi:hypothetical protein
MPIPGKAFSIPSHPKPLLTVTSENLLSQPYQATCSTAHFMPYGSLMSTPRFFRSLPKTDWIRRRKSGYIGHGRRKDLTLDRCTCRPSCRRGFFWRAWRLFTSAAVCGGAPVPASAVLRRARGSRAAELSSASHSEETPGQAKGGRLRINERLSNLYLRISARRGSA